MIFKGFTDENGNVIPVQGAGTVYDEEKNSLALGKDTVAIGQDQLVFGRKNIEDANKAEIVGGGGGVGKGNNVTIERTDGGYAGMIWYSDVQLQYIGNDAELLTFLNTKTHEEWVKLLIGDTEYADDWKASFDGLSSITPPSLNKYYFVLVNTEPRTYPLILVSNSSSLASNQTLAPIHVAISDNVLSFSSENFFFKIKEEKNLRTLDWNGTQWNAGDITCDDGSGNTISMRDLLSRIATLETAAQTNL